MLVENLAMKFLTMMVICSLLAGCFNRVDHTASPVIERVTPFYSAHVTPRRVDIWLPREYQSRPGQRFPVLYMHDGQNLLNHADATLGVAWDIDRTAQRLMDQKKIKPAIIVAVWSTSTSDREYFPERMLSNLVDLHNSDAPSPVVKTPADKYLSFMVGELKPYIDKHYRTLTDNNNTFIAGTSMGAWVSLYALAEYPHVFGSVACISANHASSDRLIQYLEEKLPEADGHRFYFDTVAKDYMEFPWPDVDEIFHEKNYQQGGDWITRENGSVMVDANFWHMRADLMLEFLLGRRQGDSKLPIVDD